MGQSLFHNPTTKSKNNSAEKGLFQSIIMLTLFQITFYMPNIFYTFIIKIYQLWFRMGQSLFHDPTTESKNNSAEKGLFQSIIMLTLFQITFYMPNIFYTFIIKIYQLWFRMGQSLFHDPTTESKNNSAEKGLFQSIIMLTLFQITFYMPNIFYTFIIKIYQLWFRMGQFTFNSNSNHMGTVGFILRQCIVGMCVVFLC